MAATTGEEDREEQAGSHGAHLPSRAIGRPIVRSGDRSRRDSRSASPQRSRSASPSISSSPSISPSLDASRSSAPLRSGSHAGGSMLPELLQLCKFGDASMINNLIDATHCFDSLNVEQHAEHVNLLPVGPCALQLQADLTSLPDLTMEHLLGDEIVKALETVPGLPPLGGLDAAMAAANACFTNSRWLEYVGEQSLSQLELYIALARDGAREACTLRNADHQIFFHGAGLSSASCTTKAAHPALSLSPTSMCPTPPSKYGCCAEAMVMSW